jgi:hypothetical protein
MARQRLPPPVERQALVNVVPEIRKFLNLSTVQSFEQGQGVKRLHHPKKGMLAFEHASFQSNDDPSLKVVIYTRVR